MEAETKANLSDRTIWVRILYMVLFVIAYSIAEFLVAVVALFQAIVVLITGRVNTALHRFGKNLSAYISAILEFETFNSEALPFPFADWPDLEPTDTHWSEDQSAPGMSTSAPDTNPAPAEVNADTQTAAAPTTDEPTDPPAPFSGDDSASDDSASDDPHKS